MPPAIPPRVVCQNMRDASGYVQPSVLRSCWVKLSLYSSSAQQPTCNHYLLSATFAYDKPHT